MTKVALWFGGLLMALLLAPVLVQPPRTQTAEKGHAAARGQELIRVLDAYRTEYEQFPTGSNEEVFAKLRGENPRRIVFLDCAPEVLNDAGELIDPWGRPFRITVGEDAMTAKVESAGADGVFGAASGKSDDYDSARDVIGGLVAGGAAASPLHPFPF